MKKGKIVSLVLSLGFLILFFIQVLVLKDEVVFLFEFWSPLPSPIIILGLSGLSMFVFLMMVFPFPIIRFGLVMIAFFGFGFLVFLTMLSMEPVQTLHHQDHTIYINEYRFIFDGEDSIYIKRNLFFATLIAKTPQSEEWSSSYHFEGETLVITKSAVSSQIEIQYVPLN